MLQPSKLLRPHDKSYPTTISWLEDVGHINAIISAALSIMHPRLYDAARHVIQSVWDGAQGGERSDIEAAMAHWPSVFNSLSVMANRRSPFHVDANGKPEWMDILLTVGQYHDTQMILPGIKLKLQYPPGTILAFSGRLLLHGVPEADGNRGCIAWYMRQAVHKAANPPDYGFAEIKDIV